MSNIPAELKYTRSHEWLKTLPEGIVESVKAASDIYAPLAATVVAINVQLAEAPELINQDPYGRGWIMRLKPTAQGAASGLLSAQDYQALAAAG